MFDPFDDYYSPEATARREHDAAREADRDREALCALLRAREQDGAALIVAASQLSLDQVDGWNGGQFEAVLAVPPPLYDVAGADAVVQQLQSAAAAMVGSDHFAGLRLTLRRGDPAEGWDWVVAQDIVAKTTGPRDDSMPGLVLKRPVDVMSSQLSSVLAETDS